MVTMVTDRWLMQQIAILLTAMRCVHAPFDMRQSRNIASDSLIVSVNGYVFDVPSVPLNVETSAIDSWLMTRVILPTLLPYGY